MTNAPAPQDHTPDEDYIGLRCNRCNKPITPAEAVLTPTGYRCKECVRGQQKVFDTSKTSDVFVAGLISAVISFAGSWLVPRLGFITLLVSPGLGLLIYNAVRWAVNKRRGNTINQAVLIGAIVGSLPMLLLRLLPLFTSGGGLLPSLGGLMPLLWQVVYSAMVSTTAYYQAKGIRLN